VQKVGFSKYKLGFLHGHKIKIVNATTVTWYFVLLFVAGNAILRRGKRATCEQSALVWADSILSAAVRSTLYV